MPKTRLLIIMLVVFAASTMVNYLIYSHFEVYIGEENTATVRAELIGAHTSVVAIIVGALFAKSRKDEYVKIPLAAIAIAFCIAWSVYISDTWRHFPSIIKANGHDGLIEQFAARSAQLSSVMAGVLGYICKKQSAGEHYV